MYWNNNEPLPHSTDDLLRWVYLRWWIDDLLQKLKLECIWSMDIWRQHICPALCFPIHLHTAHPQNKSTEIIFHPARPRYSDLWNFPSAFRTTWWQRTYGLKSIKRTSTQFGISDQGTHKSRRSSRWRPPLESSSHCHPKDPSELTDLLNTAWNPEAKY